MMATQKTTKKTWIIIPGYNEEKYVGRVLKKVGRFSSNIIFVDDGSHDKSAQIARRYTKHVLQHLTNLGKGAAMKTGCEYAFYTLGADNIIFFDSDDQHDPQYIPHFIAGFSKGDDIVLGVRSLSDEMPKLRRIGNAFSSVLIFLLFGDYIPDIPCGFKGLSKRAYEKVKWSATDYAVETEIAARMAKQRLPHRGIVIKPIYHDLDRGMTVLDILKLIAQIVSWKFSL